MICAPVKTLKEESIISPLFSKAKFFALVDRNGQKTILKNPFQGGMEVACWLYKLGVTKLIISHMGQKPLEYLTANKIQIFNAPSERTTLHQAILKLADGELLELVSTNNHHLCNHNNPNTTFNILKPINISELQKNNYISKFRSKHD